MRADRGLKNVKKSTQLGVRAFPSTFILTIDLLLLWFSIFFNCRFTFVRWKKKLKILKNKAALLSINRMDLSWKYDSLLIPLIFLSHEARNE